MGVDGIPIIGQTRAWKNLRFICQPTGRMPAVAMPGAQPELTGFMIGFEGVRSDDVPVQSLTVVPLDKFTSIGETLRIVGVITQGFESYRTCDCQPTRPCALHQQHVGGKAS